MRKIFIAIAVASFAAMVLNVGSASAKSFVCWGNSSTNFTCSQVPALADSIAIAWDPTGNCSGVVAAAGNPTSITIQSAGCGSLQPNDTLSMQWAIPCYDVNNDLLVNQEDLAIHATYGTGQVPPAPYVPWLDFNSNGIINSIDNFYLWQNYGALGSSCQTNALSSRLNDVDTFTVNGVSTGSSTWKVFVGFPLSGGTYSSNQSTLRGPLTAGAPASAFATDMAAAVNEMGVPGLSATSNGSLFTIHLDQAAAGANGGFVVAVITDSPIPCMLTGSHPDCPFNPTVTLGITSVAVGGVAEPVSQASLPVDSGDASSSSSALRVWPLYVAGAAAMLLFSGAATAVRRHRARRGV